MSSPYENNIELKNNFDYPLLKTNNLPFVLPQDIDSIGRSRF